MLVGRVRAADKRVEVDAAAMAEAKQLLEDKEPGK